MSAISRIETETRCACGCAVTLIELPAYARHIRFQACCEDCLDPAEDAGERAHVVGHGGTKEAALAEWKQMHDEAWGIEVQEVAS